MATHPEQYRRVEILPIWFNGSADLDESLTANDLKALDGRVGTHFRTALAQVLVAKGYEVVRVAPILASDEDLEQFEFETRELLGELRTNFISLSLEIYANRPNQKDKPLDYVIDSRVNDLRNRLVSPEADLVVLIDFQAFFESPAVSQHRQKWNRTGGAILTPLAVLAALYGAPATLPIQNSPDWIQLTVLVADARTQEVLLWNGRRFPGQDARNPDVLRARLRETFEDLAELTTKKKSQSHGG